jgi:hypothetical protein
VTVARWSFDLNSDRLMVPSVPAGLPVQAVTFDPV